MIRRLLCACMGAALVGVLVVPTHVVAKPPDLPEDGSFTVKPVMEVLPMPHEVSDVTCPYLRQKISDSQACKSVDQLMGREVSDNLKRLKQADKLLAKAKDLARDGLFAEALFCCVEAAELVPGSPCEQRAVDTMIKIACSYLPESDTIVTQKGDSEESDEPPMDTHHSSIEVGISSNGGLILQADYSADGSVYHLRYKQGSLSIWSTPDGTKAKP